MRRGRKPNPLVLRDGDRNALKRLASHPTAVNREAIRARGLLLAADGMGTNDIAKAVGVKASTVSRWKQLYAKGGFHSVSDAPRSGRPRTLTDDMVGEVVRLTLETSPKGATHWSTRSLAKKTGMSQSSVSRIWQAFRLKPHRTETFELSKDPLFVDKLRDVVGLYLDPPVRAVVLCVDEKTQIQALERTQTVIPMRPTKSRAISPKYRRHGTTDLFAALNYATGEVMAKCYPQHKSAEFIDFLHHVDDNIEKELDIHLIVDNHSIHRSAETLAWLLRHPRFHIHFVPTYSSWLNLVEVIFSLLTERQLKHGVHTSVDQLETAIQEFIDANNDDPKPFKWTKTADQILDKVARFCGGVLDRHGPNSDTAVPGPDQDAPNS